MKRIHKILAGTAGTLTLLAMTVVSAAPAGSSADASPCGGPARMGMMQGGGHGMGGMGGRHGMGGMAGQGLEQLKTRLVITPQQEGAWQAFAAKATAQRAAMQAQQGQATDMPTSAPERLAQQIAAMGARMAGMQTMQAALTDLYAVLTPEQRSIADQTFGHRGGAHAGHRGGPEGRPDGGHGRHGMQG